MLDVCELSGGLCYQICVTFIIDDSESLQQFVSSYCQALHYRGEAQRPFNRAGPRISNFESSRQITSEYVLLNIPGFSTISTDQFHRK